MRLLRHMARNITGEHIGGHLDDEPLTDDENLWSASKFRILHANIRGWFSHAVELTATIRSMANRPEVVCLNETFLNQAVEHIALEGYSLVTMREVAALLFSPLTALPKE